MSEFADKLRGWAPGYFDRPVIDLTDIDIAMQLQDILFPTCPVLVKKPANRQKQNAADRQQQFRHQFLFHGVLRGDRSTSGCSIKSS